MTNANTIEIKVEDTLDNLHWNIQQLNVKTVEHEQCSMAVNTLISYETDINGYSEITSLLEDQANNINEMSKFIASQYNRLHCES